MKKHYRITNFSFTFIFILLNFGILAQGNYLVTDIGRDNAFAMGINNNNEVVGYVNPGSWSNAYAFYWNATDGFKSLGGYIARDINDSGQIAGQSASLQAAVWENGGWVKLSGLQSAYAINNAGQVTGLISSQGGTYAPFRDDDIYSAGYITLTRPYLRASHGFDINNLGQVIADCGSTVTEQKYVPVFYDTDTTWKILDNGGNYDAHARSINDLSQFAGNAMTRSGLHQAVYWDSPDSDMEYMGSLGSGNSVAYSINNLGQAVGSSDGKAFFWSKETGMLDLNTLIDSSLNIELTTAADINDQGSIFSTGRDSQGNLRSYVLVVPEPCTLSLIGLGGLLLRRSRNRSKAC